MTLSYLEAVTFLVSFTFIFWETSQESGASFREYYDSKKKDLQVRLPGWVFGLAWFIIKTCISLALFFFLRNNSNVSVAIFVVWVVNEVSRKTWTTMFMDYKRPGVALVLSFIIFATAGALVIMLGIDGRYWPMGLMIPYALWSGLACYLNWDWVSMETYTSKPMETKWKIAV